MRSRQSCLIVIKIHKVLKWASFINAHSIVFSFGFGVKHALGGVCVNEADVE